MKRALLLFAVLVCLAGRAKGQAEIPHFASAPATCDSTRGQIYYDTTLKALQVCTATNTWGSSSSSIKNAIDGNNPVYGLFWDTVLLCDGVDSSGSPNFSSASATFTAADIGKTLKATSGGVSCGENQAFTSGTTIAGKIITITNAHNVVLDTNAVGTAVSGATFAYGHLDDVGLSAMETACKAQFNPCEYIMPAGLGMMNNQHFNDKTAVNATQQVIASQVTGYSGPIFHGKSPGATGIVLGPLFVPANCTGGASSNRCMGGVNGAVYRDFFIHGICDQRTGQTDNVAWFGIGYSDSIENVNLRCYGVLDSGFRALFGDSLGGRAGTFIVDGFSQLGIQLSSSSLNSTYGPITVADISAGCFITVGGAGKLTAQEFIIYFGSANTNSKGVCITAGSTLEIKDIEVTENFGTNAVQGVSNSGTLYLSGGQIDTSGNSAGQAFQNLSGGKAYIANTSFKGGSAGWDIFNLAGATLIDQGGNVPVQGRPIAQAGSTWSGVGALRGSCSGVATASSTLGLFGLGQNAALTCTSIVVNLGRVMDRAGTAYDVIASATAGGVNASSGVVTVLKNNVAQTITCTIGTGTTCADSAHTFTFVPGDVISVQFTTQAADTLAGVSATVVTM